MLYSGGFIPLANGFIPLFTLINNVDKLPDNNFEKYLLLESGYFLLTEQGKFFVLEGV